MLPVSLARIIFSILNFIASVSLAYIYFFWFLEGGKALDVAFTGGLPVLLAIILSLISGILTMKNKSWWWAFSGLVVAGLVWIYYLILLWVVSWT